MTLSLLDTTILSNFAHTRRPELVQLALGNQVATTPTVLAELHQGEALGLVPLVDWHWLPVLTLTAAEQALAKQQQNVLDAGEAECLAVAIVRQAWFLSDDLAARRLAQVNQVAISGSIGLQLHLIQKDALTLIEADQLLAAMIQRGYRSPVATLQAYLEDT